MKSTNIPLSECYAIQIHKQPTGRFQNITITETFSGSKVPGEQRRIWDITTSADVLRQIATAITEESK